MNAWYTAGADAMHAVAATYAMAGERQGTAAEKELRALRKEHEGAVYQIAMQLSETRAELVESEKRRKAADGCVVEMAALLADQRKKNDEKIAKLEAKVAELQAGIEQALDFAKGAQAMASNEKPKRSAK